MKNISLFVDNGTYLTKIHPFTKLMYILMAISVPLIGGQLWLFPCLIAVSLCVLISGKLLRKAFPLIAFSFTIILVIFVIHGLFHQGNTNVLFSIGKLHFYREGLLYATRIGCNILNMLLSFATFVLSTRPQELVEQLERHGFSKKFGYVVNSVFQIIPQMMGTMDTITDAQRSRGMETEGNLWTRARAFLPLISPVVMSSLINTRERAIALEIRAFDSKTKKTWLADRARHKGDTALTIGMLLVIVVTIALRVLGIL